MPRNLDQRIRPPLQVFRGHVHHSSECRGNPYSQDTERWLFRTDWTATMTTIKTVQYSSNSNTCTHTLILLTKTRFRNNLLNKAQKQRIKLQRTGPILLLLMTEHAQIHWYQAPESWWGWKLFNASHDSFKQLKLNTQNTAPRTVKR